MDRLWAPWRRQFVEKGDKEEGCIFCLFPAQTGAEADRQHLILARSAHAFVILNKYPYTSGHLMVVPRRHTSAFDELPADELHDLDSLLQQAIAKVKEAYRPDGVNVGMNLGKAAGAGIADHLHWHVVPRWVGDTNFMTTVGEARVLIESLDSTYDRLHPLFQP